MNREFFLSYIFRLREWWQELKLNQKVFFAACVFFVVGLISLSTIYFTTEYYVPLVVEGKLTSPEVSVIQSHLEQMHIPYKITHENGIYVPASVVNNIKADLTDYLPKTTTAKGYELFDSNTWIKGEKELQVLELRALKGQLENDLTRFENVKSATVVLDIAPVKTFGGSPYKTKASIILNLKPNTQLNSSELRAITNHMTGAVRGLTPNMIAISDTTGKLYQAINPEGTIDIVRNAEIDSEEQLESKIDGLLSTLVGQDNYFTTIHITIARDNIPSKETVQQGLKANTLNEKNPIHGAIENVSVSILINKRIFFNWKEEEIRALESTIQQQIATILQGFGSAAHQTISFIDFKNTPIESLNQLQTSKTNTSTWPLYLIGIISLISFISIIWALKTLGKRSNERRSNAQSLETMVNLLQQRIQENPKKAAQMFKDWIKE